MLYAVIMAGGSGTRFWPESRARAPKQLLRLVGERSMIGMTVDRLGDLAPPERTLVVTNVRLVDAMAAELPELARESIVGEPCRRDTAPCIALAAMMVSRNDPDATMAVMPADHVIRPEAAFQEAIRQAARLVDSRPARIVTFGIQPSYPAETFGYIERGEPLELSREADAPAYKVVRFREKPNATAAAEYLAAGNFYWNSGIFVWKARTILSALARHAPELLAHLQAIDRAWGADDYRQVFNREFAAIQAISIDYAVMEKADDVAVIEASFEWDDVGSWQSLARLVGADAEGNTIVGKHLGLNTQGTIVRSDSEHLIVTLGLKDSIVVHTPDATLVANKHDEESIRQVVKLLEEQGWGEYL